MMAQCLKILGKVSSSIASEANLVLSRQKMVENAKKKNLNSKCDILVDFHTLCDGGFSALLTNKLF